MQPVQPEAGVLHVRLGEVHVGTLTRLADEVSEFVISEEYRQRYPRPILGQFFEDDLSRRHSSRMRLPPFFSNLLPEGHLRDLIAEKQGIDERIAERVVHAVFEEMGAAMASGEHVEIHEFGRFYVRDATTGDFPDSRAISFTTSIVLAGRVKGGP